jgi:hypothetical protein
MGAPAAVGDPKGGFKIFGAAVVGSSFQVGFLSAGSLPCGSYIDGTIGLLWCTDPIAVTAGDSAPGLS